MPGMSPAPARTSREAILVAARELLEEEGLDAVAMHRVAERVGVRGPSLYKRVPNRAALIRAVGDAVAADLGRVIDAALRPGSADAAEDIRTLGRAYRDFVRRNPNGYGLLFAHLEPELQADPDVLAALGRPIVATMARLIGDAGALDAGRTFVAWAHGFTSMELAGGFRLGGDVDAAFATGIELILAGISERATQGQG
jgi:AcrR family transcriptional regulator